MGPGLATLPGVGDGDGAGVTPIVTDGEGAVAPISDCCLGADSTGPMAKVATAMTAALERIRTARRIPARRAREAAMQRAPYRGVPAATIRAWLNH